MTCGEFFSEELALAAPHGGFARASHKLAPARDMPLAVAIFWLRVPFTGAARAGCAVFPFWGRCS